MQNILERNRGRESDLEFVDARQGGVVRVGRVSGLRRAHKDGVEARE